MSNDEKKFYVWVLNFDDSQVHRHTVDKTIAEDVNALEQFLFEQLDYDDGSIQYMVNEEPSYVEDT